MSEQKQKNILVGYDGSNAAKDALELGIELSQALGAKLWVITSLPGGDESTAEEIDQATRGLEYAKSRADKAAVANETHLLVRGRSPGEDIVDFAREQAADLVVIGVRRRSQVGKLLFGSTSRHVILEAPCPVVTIK